MTKEEFVKTFDFFDGITIYSKDLEKFIEYINSNKYEEALLLTHPDV